MQNIKSIIETRIKNNKADTFVVIVPNEATRLKRQRELIGCHPNGAVVNLQVFDIENFVGRLYAQVRSQRHRISPGLQNLWIHEIADPASSNTSEYNELRPIQDNPIPDSTLSLIVNTINNLRDSGDSPEDIHPNNSTDADLLRIYSKYEEKLKEKWVDDKGTHLYLANNFNTDYFKYAFPQSNLVSVEGFTVLSKADIKILTSIAKMPKLDFWFRTDCLEENTDLYGNIIHLTSQFRDVNANIDTGFERDPDRHLHFAKSLFKSSRQDANSQRIDLTDQIRVLKPVDRTEEVEVIAQRIQELVSESHCKLDEICVAYYNIAPYQQRIAEIFPSYGIPYSLSENLTLSKAEIVKEILSRLSPRQESIGNTYFLDEVSDQPPNSCLPNEFQEYIDNFLNDEDILQRILNPMLHQKSEIVEGEINAFQQFKKIVTELCDILKSEDDRAYRIDEYIEKLKYIARHTYYQNRVPVKGGTVKILSLGGIRGSEYNTVFLGDFVDGVFPRPYNRDPVLSDIPYRTREEQLYDNRFLFYRVLKSYRERLYLLIPQRERNSALIPSLFLSQLEGIVDIERDENLTSERRSIPGFLSAYGNYVWETEDLEQEQFPTELETARKLINHVVQVEKSRASNHKHLAYEGRLNQEDLLRNQSLSDRSRQQLNSLRNHTYSVTELESYGNCPFQYFVGRVLKFTVSDDEEEVELSSLEKGNLVHNVVRTFYTNLREHKVLSLTQCTDDAYDNVKELLNETLISESDRILSRRTDINEKNLFWEIDLDKTRTSLHNWLDAERSNELSAIPSYFEVGIGQTGVTVDRLLGTNDPIEIGNVKISGKIDRIDIGEGSFNIIDYKTGSSTIRISDILEGRRLQLPIYLQLAETLLNERGLGELIPAAGLYYKIRLEKFTSELGIAQESLNDISFNNYNGKEWKYVSPKNGQLLDDDYFSSILSRVNGYVQQYVNNIAEGIFPLIIHVDEFVESEMEGCEPITPRDLNAPCNYCSYKRICRVGAFAEGNLSEE